MPPSRLPVPRHRSRAQVALRPGDANSRQAITPCERPETWVTERSGHMGNTFRLSAGGIDAVGRVFGDGGATSLCGSATGGRVDDGCVSSLRHLAPVHVQDRAQACPGIEADQDDASEVTSHRPLRHSFLHLLRPTGAPRWACRHCLPGAPGRKKEAAASCRRNHRRRDGFAGGRVPPATAEAGYPRDSPSNQETATHGLAGGSGGTRTGKL